jgi:hypothetical protein
MNDTDIKHFVRDTLGCTCPDDVFDKIELQEANNNQVKKINIGDKLLIYILQNCLKDGKLSSLSTLKNLL